MGRPANHAWLGSEWTRLPDLVVGALVGIDFTVWRVVEVGPRPADLAERDRTHAVVLEPLAGGQRPAAPSGVCGVHEVPHLHLRALSGLPQLR